MDSESFGRGIGFGIFLTILIQTLAGYYVYCYVTKNRILISQGSDDRELKPTLVKDWPQPVVDFLKRSFQPLSTDTKIVHDEMQSMSPTGDCFWLNLLVHRLFLVLRMSDTFKSVWARKMNNKINMKLKSNAFIGKLHITELDLGDFPPVLKGIRLLKGITHDLALMCEIDLEYRGGASIAIETTLVNGTVIPVKVTMNEFNGTIQTRLPSERWADMYGFHFVQDPGATFQVDTPITLRDNETVRAMINKVLSSLMRRTFLDLWVAPSWRTAYLPLMEPGLEEWLMRQELDKQLDQSRKKSLGFNKSSLWAGQGSKKPMTKDGLEGILFDVDFHIPFGELDLVRQLEVPLVANFESLMNEPVDNRKPIRKLQDKLMAQTSNVSAEELDAAEDVNQDQATWKVVKSTKGIQVHRKRYREQETGLEVAFHRGIISISCDATRVYNILSNPVHFRHVYEQFVDTKVLFEGTSDLLADERSIHNCTFQIGKEIKSFEVLQTKVKNESEEVSFVVVMRSVGGYTLPEEGEEQGNERKSFEDDNSTSSAPTIRLRHKRSISESSQATNPGLNTSPQMSKSIPGLTENSFCYIFGYSIVQGDGENQCQVQVLSQFSSDLHKLEVDFIFCRKLKQFIEELTMFTDYQNEAEPKRPFSGISEGKIRNKLVYLFNQANFVGNTANYLLKGHQKLAVRNSNPDVFVTEAESQRSSVSSSVADLQTETSIGEERKAVPTRVDSQGSLLSDFGIEPYIERTISPKEVVRVEIGFNRASYGDQVALKWEYSCKSEQAPAFAIHYIPDSLEITEMARLLPYGQSGSRVVFPLISVNAYSQPAYGTIPISHLKSGRFVFIWDNSTSFSKRFFKSIAYKILIANSDTSHQVHCNVGISRKSIFSIPIIHDPLLDMSELSIDFSTHSFHVPFSLHYDPIVTENAKQEPGDVSSRLNDLVSGSPLQPRKTLIPFNRTSSKGAIPPTAQVIPIKGNYGVYTLIWDNTASIVSTRYVDIHVKIN